MNFTKARLQKIINSNTKQTKKIYKKTKHFDNNYTFRNRKPVNLKSTTLKNWCNL